MKVLISAAIFHLIIMLLLLSKILLVSLHLLTSKKVCISFIPGQGSEIKNLPSVRQTTLDFRSIFKEVLTYATPLLMVTLPPKRRLFQTCHEKKLRVNLILYNAKYNISPLT